MTLQTVSLCFALALALALPDRAWGQSLDASAGESKAYREAIANALQEFDLGNYAEAREQFRVAHKLAPSARTLRGLGITDFELRNYPESVRLLEQALASGTKPLEGVMRREAEGVLDRARGYVGEVTLELTPREVEVTIDGQPTKLPLPSLLLPVGDHVLEFSATGYASQRRAVTVIGRGSETVTVELATLAAPPSADLNPLQREHPPERPPAYTRWWVWTTVAVVAAGAGVTTALLVRRARDKSYEDVPYPSPDIPPGLEKGLVVPTWR